MIRPQKRKAVFTLHEEGMSIKEISHRLCVSRNTVRTIIKQRGDVPGIIRRDRIEIDTELLRKLYSECNGRIQRIHEKLNEEEGIKIGYSTLARMIYEYGISEPAKKRCEHVPDRVAAEMQHDTSYYKIKTTGKQVKLVCSLLYFRYSKVRYLKFYRSFDRFKMKCFFHEALTFFGCTAKACIIDNTNLARLRGTGKNAVIVPEMDRFAEKYGFKFVCHEVNHSNRKAGCERGFYTIETNFLPGRNFESLEDLNRQAFDWATKKMANRPVGKTGLIPAKAFEYEQCYLVKLPPFLEPPYCIHKRKIDQYGHIMFAGNFYWVPGIIRCEVTMLQYEDCIKIYHKRNLLVNYELPAEDVKNQSFYPQGQPKPTHKPNNRKRPTHQEEKKLRSLEDKVGTYLDFAIKSKGIQKHKFIRELFALLQKVALPVFIKTVERALKYRITDINTVERISMLLIKEGDYKTPLVETDNEFQNRQQYLEGRLSDDVDLSAYDKLGDKDNE